MRRHWSKLGLIRRHAPMRRSLLSLLVGEAVVTTVVASTVATTAAASTTAAAVPVSSTISTVASDLKSAHYIGECTYKFGKFLQDTFAKKHTVLVRTQFLSLFVHLNQYFRSFFVCVLD